MERMFHMRIYRLFHAQRNFLHRQLLELGLGAGQPKLLAYLVDHGPCQQKELADYFEIDPSAVCRMLDGLERSGFLVRSPGEDRRSGRIQLTEAGRRASAAWREHCIRREQVMLRGFSDEERSRFADYLTRAYQNLRDAQGEGGGAV